MGAVALAMTACSGGEGLPVGKAFRGDTFIVVLEDTRRVQEIRYEGTDQAHYLVVPSSIDKELVAVKLQVHNERATKVLVDVTGETAELRGFGNDERYDLIDPTPLNTQNVQVVSGPHPTEDRFVPFITGSAELPQGFSITGWIVFEVPKGIKLREIRWEAGGDVVFIRN